MVDVVDQATRSRMMAGIRHRDTKPEREIRSLLHRAGYRFRLGRKDLPGKPDIVLPKFKAVVFVHGCFWHGHECPMFKWPATRAAFWRAKIRGNVERDGRVERKLRALDWRLLKVWECALRGRRARTPQYLSSGMAKWLQSKRSRFEITGKAA